MSSLALTSASTIYMANYSKELRMRVDIRKKGKVEKTMKFAERMKTVQEKTETTLRKMQEEMKRQVNKRRMEAKK